MPQAARREAPASPRARRPARAPRTRARSSPPAGGEPRTRARAPTRDRATARHRRRTRSGRSSAASDSRPRTASPTRNGFGAGPALSPNATASASRWGCGRRSHELEERRAQLLKRRERRAPSRPRRRRCGRPGTPAPASTAYSSSAVLPTPGSPCTTRTPPCPPRAASSSRSSTSRSRWRPSSCSPGDPSAGADCAHVARACLRTTLGSRTKEFRDSMRACPWTRPIGEP